MPKAELSLPDELQIIIDERTRELENQLAQLTAKHAVTRSVLTGLLEGVTGNTPGPNQSEQIVSDDDAITS